LRLIWSGTTRDSESMKRTNPIAIRRADSESEPDLRSTRRKGMKKTPASPIQRRRNSRLPDFVTPQLATLVDRVPQGDDWLHEIKFDGYRILCRISDGDICSITRNRQDWTERLSFLAQAANELPVNRALLDGEVVALNENGTTNFQLLQNSLSTHASDNLAYYVFDLLHLDGKDLMQLPLLQRKETLAEILKANSPSSAIRYSEHWLGQGDRLYDEACRAGLEGVISKRADQPYRSGRSRDWVKTKCVQNQEFVIGGFTDPAGSRAGLGALLVGVHDERGRLVYAGKVGTGFSRQSLTELRSRLDPLVSKSSPFVNPPRGAEARGVHWVKPELIGAVSFAEWTSDNMLRHPSFQGLREDKPPVAITRERASGINNSKASKRDETIEIAGVKLTHPDRVLYPEQGITKRELALYFEQIADWILPQVAGRPLTLVRCPEGQSKECFYQRHVTDSASEWLRPVPIKEKGKLVNYVAVDNLQGLIALVQMGVLELHTWGCTSDCLDRPDRLIFDLDPDPEISWKPLKKAAQSLHAYLSDLGLSSFAKTTGGKGLHVVVPLVPKIDWETAKEFSKQVAQQMADREPDRYTATMSKAKRRGKIYIDYLRNARTATAVAAYSTRAHAGAPVSMPLRWDELGADIRGAHFNLRNTPERLSQIVKDPWQEYETARRAITAALLKKL
jgi:bifunctional non-homologous end joining protein LigD